MHKRFKRNKLTHVCRVLLKFWRNSVMFLFYFYLLNIIGCWDCKSSNYDWQWIYAMGSACAYVLKWPPSTPEVRCLIPIFTFYPSFHNELRVLFPVLLGLLTCSLLYSFRSPSQLERQRKMSKLDCSPRPTLDTTRRTNSCTLNQLYDWHIQSFLY